MYSRVARSIAGEHRECQADSTCGSGCFPAFKSLRQTFAAKRPAPRYRDEQIDAFTREKIETAYHPSCSCKMGASSDPHHLCIASSAACCSQRLKRIGPDHPPLSIRTEYAESIAFPRHHSHHILFIIVIGRK
jgi:hypothetical protein